MSSLTLVDQPDLAVALPFGLFSSAIVSPDCSAGIRAGCCEGASPSRLKSKLLSKMLPDH